MSPNPQTTKSSSGARYYHSDISIWLSVDPMADKYPGLSPYIYCAGNPVRFTDPNGKMFGPPDKEKKEILRAYKAAIRKQAIQNAEIAFYRSVTPHQYESDNFKEGAKTLVNEKVNIKRAPKTWKSAFAEERKFNGNISIDENEVANADIYYLPGEDESYNVITDVYFIGKSARPIDGKFGWWVQFKGKNNREIGNALFSSEKDYKKLQKQTDKLFKTTVLTLAKEYDATHENSNQYSRWKAYFDSKQ